MEEIIKLKCNKCDSKFKLIYTPNKDDDGYHVCCPNCGHSGYMAIEELHKELYSEIR